jgi:GNAT superfamily N-acetyltransferase
MYIEEYGPNRQQDVIDLANRVLGAGFFENPSQIKRDVNGVLLLAVEDDETLSGFARGRLLPAGEFSQFIDNQLQDIPQELRQADAAGALGVIQTVVVSPDQQGKSIGTRLMNAIHDKLIGLGADKLVVTFKRGPMVPHVDRWMKKLGFDFWIRLESFWKERCESDEFHCAERGADGCKCAAMFYRKRIF